MSPRDVAQETLSSPFSWMRGIDVSATCEKKVRCVRCAVDARDRKVIVRVTRIVSDSWRWRRFFSFFGQSASDKSLVFRPRRKFSLDHSLLSLSIHLNPPEKSQTSHHVCRDPRTIHWLCRDERGEGKEARSRTVVVSVSLPAPLRFTALRLTRFRLAGPVDTPKKWSEVSQAGCRRASERAGPRLIPRPRLPAPLG